MLNEVAGNSQKLFNPKLTWNIQGELVSFHTPKIMGILNLTPDSFYSASRHTEFSVVQQAEQMLDKGAFILDLGAVSSRPGAKQLSSKEEKDRLLPSLKAIRKTFPSALISVDTWQSEVARIAVEYGADIINDISAGELDKRMTDTIAELGVPYIAMHMQGRPETMQKEPNYNNVVQDVLLYLAKKTAELKSKGIIDFSVDPGFGFGKSLEHNYQLLKSLPLFEQLECPILVGVSRKSMINKVLDINASEALNGTSILHTIALLNSAKILRVHDVGEAAEAIKLVHQYQIT